MEISDETTKLRGRNRSTPPWRAILAMGTCLTAAACGLPKPPDMAAEMGKGMRALGVMPVYPLQENMRIGQIWIEDVSTSASNGGAAPGVPTTLRVSDQLVVPMEAVRAEMMKTPARFEKPISSIQNDVFAGGTAPHYFKQDPKDNLALAAMPSYSLAAVDQAAASGAASTAFASIASSFSLSQSKYLTVEAVGVHIVDLPLDRMAQEVQRACRSGRGVFGDSVQRQAVQTAAYQAMRAWWGYRKNHAQSASFPEFQPQMAMLRRVYYLRGIRFVFHDDRAAALAASAAFNPRLPEGVTPPSAPTQPAVTPPTNANANVTTQLTEISKQLAEIQKSLPANNNINLSLQGTRATARGIEMIQLFERPLAFGYDPLVTALTWDKTNQQANNGISDLCGIFDPAR